MATDHLMRRWTMLLLFKPLWSDGLGSEIKPIYLEIAQERLGEEFSGFARAMNPTLQSGALGNSGHHDQTTVVPLILPWAASKSPRL